jgi:hypothetical protein
MEMKTEMDLGGGGDPLKLVNRYTPFLASSLEISVKGPV